MDERAESQEEGNQAAVAEISVRVGAELRRERLRSALGPHYSRSTPLHVEAGLAREHAGNPALRRSLGSASPSPAQPEWPNPPHLVSKYTLGGCQESGGIAAIAKPAESSSNCYFRRRFSGDPPLQHTLPVPVVQPWRCQGLGT